MDIDSGRKFDIEEIYLMIKNARSSGEKNHWEELLHKIFRESKATRELREKLIRAIRSNDRNAVHYFSKQLENIQQEETYGHYI